MCANLKDYNVNVYPGMVEERWLVAWTKTSFSTFRGYCKAECLDLALPREKNLNLEMTMTYQTRQITRK